MSESRHPYHDVVQRAWSDPSYKQRLVTDTRSVLVEAGFDPSFEGEFQVHENDAATFYLVLPQKPRPLSENDLDQVAGGQFAQPGVPAGPYVYPYPYPAPYPYPYPYPSYPYSGPVIIGNPNSSPGPILNNGSWSL